MKEETSKACHCSENECAASCCVDCNKYRANAGFSLKRQIAEIHGSHHVGDAQHTRLYWIFNEVDALHSKIERAIGVLVR